MSGEILKKFGRYFLLDQVAQGGMAEINRARLASSDGGGRILVIKRIQAGFGGNSEFYQMFKSEIKVTMGFNHPNIVQLYDFGEEEGQPYIAMEWVDGKNLRQFLARFAEIKQTFPIDLASYVIEQAASGLNYAHGFKDKLSGQPLNIVHRDISPQNVLIAFEGTVKVIDFGIAKANSNIESTRAGVIKGKPSYLSPEQISGEVLDGRSDLFALGIVLWELLTGKKLFAGESDLAVLKLIESCNSHVKPPSTLNPKVPKELDYIVLKCLAKQREKRYQSCEELQRALHKFLYSFSPDFNPGDLAYYAKDLFKNEIVEDRKRIQKLNEKVEALIATSSATGIAVGFGESQPPQSPGAHKPVQKAIVLEMDKTSKHEKIQIEAPRQLGSRSVSPAAPQNFGRSQSSSRNDKPGSQSSRTESSKPPRAQAQASGGYLKQMIIGAAALFAVAFFGPDYGIQVPVLSSQLASLLGSGSSAELKLDGQAKNVLVTVNGNLVANQLPYVISGMPVGTPFQLKVESATGQFSQEVTLKKGEKRTLPVVFVDRAMASLAANAGAAGAAGTTSGMETNRVPQTIVGAGEPGKSVLMRLAISPSPRGVSLSLNGQSLNPENPLVQVPLDTPLELVAEKSGFRSFRKEFSIPAAQAKGSAEWAMGIDLEPTRFGTLSIRTTPSADAIILIDGQPIVKKTPLQDEKLPVGNYTIKLVNEILGLEKTVNVNIQEGKPTSLDERLKVRSPAGD